MKAREKIDLSPLRERWPSAIVCRTEVRAFSGGYLNPRTLSKLDCQGRGPKGRFRIGRKVCYPIDSLISFLEEQAVPIKEKKHEN